MPFNAVVAEAATTCIICTDEMLESESIFSLEQCNHKYHTKCIVNWFRTPNNGGSCPLCRDRSHTPTRLTPVDIEERAKFLRKESLKKYAPRALVQLGNRVRAREKKWRHLKKEKQEFVRSHRPVLKKSRSLNREVRKSRLEYVALLRSLGIAHFEKYPLPALMQNRRTYLGSYSGVLV